MIAMQYKILLPENYDMNNIRKRVAANGHKTDGFQDLLFKAYLITESKSEGEDNHNQYSPLYLWKDSAGMNKFIFNGFYDNILNSFGWQNIKTGIPLIYMLESNFIRSKYVIEIEKEILPATHMKSLDFSFIFSDCTGRVLIYNPDKWKYSEYYFFANRPASGHIGILYDILHLSM